VGTTPAAMLGRTVFDYYPAEQAQRFFDHDREVMRSGRALVGREEPALELMESLGFALVEAHDGQAMLESAQAHRPDLVITDLVMPVMNGLEAIARLRRLPELADVPVIAISANASGGDEARSVAAGASAFLRKPVAVDRLLAKVGELLHPRWIPASRPLAAADEPT
jgi:CheY-like chemotaxis protein